MNTTVQTIAGRYQLLDHLGTGGMGAVYRAYDRLTGTEVALKRVMTDEMTNHDDDRPNRHSMTALAREFRTLAGLRHPHIISVRDFGFDEQKYPFFTMTLVRNAQTISAYSKGRSLEERADLLIGALQAISYLHRQHILHRDLKPGNVLVDDCGHVRVLDFGLAISSEITRSDSHEAALGTLAFTAPELFESGSPTVLSDIYAIGLLCYEVLAGFYPYDSSNIPLLVRQIIMDEIDYSYIDPTLREFVRAMTMPDPQERIQSADLAIQQLCAAVGRDVPEENQAAQEGTLRAARFVGRKHEMNWLLDKLNMARQGEGSVCFVEGESGVGKSRLLEEFRIRAMVTGALVVRGQAIADAGQVLPSWRQPLRRIMLDADISPLDASILKDVVPDVSRLLGMDVPDAPPLHPSRILDRITQSIVEVLRGQDVPIVIVLEDMHLGTDCLEPLRLLTPLTSRNPWLIVASYRNDEAPGLADDFAGVEQLMVPRLSDEAIADLSESMLGDVGRSTQLLNLIARETSGNAFFMVEVVRTLAEGAGGLNSIGSVTLPKHVMAHGIQQVLQQRISHVPAWGQDLLQLAAASGRGVMLDLLQHITETQPDLLQGHTLREWLQRCAEAPVFELVDEQWQFTHERLRETVLETLEPNEIRELHRTLALTIEARYGEDPEFAAMLMRHWREAGDTQRELHYGLCHAENAQHSMSVDVLEALLRRLGPLVRTEDHGTAQALESEMRLSVLWIQVNMARIRPVQANECAVRLANLAEAAGNMQMMVTALSAQATLLHGNADSMGALEMAQAVIDYVQDIDAEFDSVELVPAMVIAGIAYGEQGDLDTSMRLLNQVLDIAEAAQRPDMQARALLNIGTSAYFAQDIDTAISYFEQSIEIRREIGDRRRLAISLSNLAGMLVNRGEYERAEELVVEAIDVSQSIGNLSGEAEATLVRGLHLRETGKLEQSRQAYLTVVNLLDSSKGLIRRKIYAMEGLAITCAGLKDTATAVDVLMELLDMVEPLSSNQMIGVAMRAAATVAEELAYYESAFVWSTWLLAQPHIHPSRRDEMMQIIDRIRRYMEPHTIGEATREIRGRSVQDIFASVRHEAELWAREA